MNNWLFFSMRGLGWLVLLIGFGLLYKMRGGFGAQFLFFTCALAFAFALFCTLLQSRKIQVRRSCFSTYVAGDCISVDVKVTVRGVLPVFWLHVRDEWHEQWLFLGLKRSVHYTYSIEDMRRGKYDREKLHIYQEDPLGLFRMKQQVSAPIAFTVLPKALPWNTNRLLQHMAVGDDADELRDYKVGDALQRVHWKLSAKRDAWVVRDSAQRSSHDWTVLIDGAAMSWHDASTSKEDAFERAVEMAAHFVQKVSLKGSCGMICVGSERIELPMRQVRHVSESLNVLAAVEPNGEKRFAEVLRHEVPKLPVGTGVLCMTPNLTVDLAKSIAKVGRFGYRIAVVVCEHDNQTIGNETAQAVNLLDRMGAIVIRNARLAKGGAAGA